MKTLSIFYQERQAPITASHDQAKIRKSKMDDVVKRLTLLMVFYCATVYLTYGGMGYLLNKADALETSLKHYFYCSMLQPNCPKGTWNKEILENPASYQVRVKATKVFFPKNKI